MSKGNARLARAWCSGVWVRGLGFGVWGSRILGFGVSGFGSRVSGLGFQGFGSRGFGFRVSGLGFRGFGPRVSDFGFQVSGFGSGFGFRVPGFGVRVSGFGSRVSGFGFRVSGSWFGFMRVPQRAWPIGGASASRGGRRTWRRAQSSSHRMYLSISFRKSTPPQNRQLISCYR